MPDSTPLRQRRSRRPFPAALGSLTVVTVLASLAFVSAARAAELACGDVVTGAVVVLESDIGPCPAGGLIVGSSNVTLDLNGHTIFGTPAAADGVGILVEGRRNVVINNGTIRDFDAGVVFARKGPRRGTVDSRIVGVTITQNVGRPPSDPSGPTQFSDGIVLVGSSRNLIEDNVVTANGRGIQLNVGSSHNAVRGNDVANNLGVGIALISAATHNLLEANSVTGNSSNGIAFSFDDADNVVQHNLIDSNRGSGIRTSVGSDRNVIHANTVTNNLQAGIALDYGNDQQVHHNTVVHNGLDGIRLGGGDDDIPAVRNVAAHNVVESNGRSGIVIRCTFVFAEPTLCIAFDQHHQVLENIVTGNGGANAGTQQVVGNQLVGNFDLIDTNTDANPAYPDGAAECDANVWSGNTFGTAFPACTTG